MEAIASARASFVNSIVIAAVPGNMCLYERDPDRRNTKATPVPSINHAIRLPRKIPALLQASTQPLTHVFLVIEPSIDLHGTWFQSEGLKPLRRIELLRRYVFRVDAQHQLDGIPRL